jgi:branched-chain amino acid transport system permease protein
LNALKPLIDTLRRRTYLFFFLAVLIFAIAPIFIENDFYLDGFILIFIWGAFAGAWNIISGHAGMVSLGHNAFFGIGAYTSTLLLLRFGLTPWIGMLIGGALASSVGLLIGIICFRLRSHYFALATLAFGQVMSIVAMNWISLTNGAEGLAIPIKPSLYNMAFASKLPYLYIGLLLLLTVIGISYAIEHSKLGYYLTAFRENEEAARALGVKTGRVRLTAMVISSFLAAIIGTFYAQYLVFIDPTSVIRIQISVQVALFAIVGGIGTTLGPTIGALIFIPMTIALRAKLGTSLPGLHLVIYGAILIIVLLYMPKGIFGTLKEKVTMALSGSDRM